MNTSLSHPSHAPHSAPAIKSFPDRLAVVTVISNPMRYHSRYRLYRAFEKHVADSGADLFTVEMAFGGRPFEITDPLNPRHIQVRGDHEIWHKENLGNIGFSRVPLDYRYLAFVDGDFTFARPDWAQETLQQLQHHAVVQMFSQVVYLGPEDEALTDSRGTVMSGPGFVETWLQGKVFQTPQGRARKEIFYHRTRAAVSPDYPTPGKFSGLGAPGGAWAFRREALDNVGGLVDFCILGSGDWHMSAALIGQVELTMLEGYSDGYKNGLRDWQDRAMSCIRANIGQVTGTAFHHWHGKMRQRGYGDRKQILIKHKFDPQTDLKRDTQGLWRLHDDGSDRFIYMRDDIRSYFRMRNEDSIDT
jgi:hypothetical protein